MALLPLRAIRSMIVPPVALPKLDRRRRAALLACVRGARARRPSLALEILARPRDSVDAARYRIAPARRGAAGAAGAGCAQASARDRIAPAVSRCATIRSARSLFSPHRVQLLDYDTFYAGAL